FSGYVTDKSGVKEVTIDGEKADLVYNEAEDQYEFSYTLTHEEDGFYFHHIKAVDNAGNEAEIGRRYFVDSEKATIEVETAEKTKEDTLNRDVNVEVNFDEFTFDLNGNDVYRTEWSSPYGFRGLDEAMEVELDLEFGVNEFEFKVVDLGGQETTETIEVERVTDVSHMQNLVEVFKDNGEIEGDATARMLIMQLIAISHYVDTDQENKAVKHMNSFKQLVDMLQQTEKVTEEAGSTLKEHADYLIEKWQ